MFTVLSKMLSISLGLFKGYALIQNDMSCVLLILVSGTVFKLVLSVALLLCSLMSQDNRKGITQFLLDRERRKGWDQLH